MDITFLDCLFRSTYGVAASYAKINYIALPLYFFLLFFLFHYYFFCIFVYVVNKDFHIRAKQNSTFS